MTTNLQERGIEFGWRVHDALDAWTGKVDTKASIVLAIEVALVGFTITLSTDEGPLSSVSGLAVNVYRVGVGLVCLATALSLIIVVPQLARRQSRQSWRSGMIYFGHLRHWDAKKLAQAMRDQDDVEEQLAAQLIAMSRIAWRKHAWLQASVACLLLGVVILTLAAWL